MIINKNLILDYQLNGVVLIKNAISSFWLNQISIGIKKNFQNPSEYKCVYEKANSKELFYDDYCNCILPSIQ